MRFRRHKVTDKQMAYAHKVLKRYRFPTTASKRESLNISDKDSIVIYDVDEVNAVLQKQDRKSALVPILNGLLEEKNYRPISIANKNLINEVLAMRYKFPNFETVIDRVAKSLSLSLLNITATIAIPPILLVGGAGIGKTRFLTELANTLNVNFHKCDLSSMSAGFVLSGASSVWADGRPGLVTSSLRNSQTANFIMLLDEIDKVSSDARHDPLGCLYSLLERKTAESFVDEALEIKMNCSAINWFASANYIEQIPEPILSRFTIFEIQEPTHEQQCLIVQSVYDDLLADHPWGEKFENHLCSAVVQRLVELPARKQKSALLVACSEVAFRQKVKVETLLKIEVDDIKFEQKTSQKTSIGFI